MKKSELLKEMQLSAADFNRLATARGVEIKGEYSDEEVVLLKSNLNPQSASTPKAISRQEANEDLNDAMSTALAIESQQLNRGAKEGAALANRVMQVKVGSYAAQKLKLETQFLGVLQKFDNAFDQASSTLEIDAEVEDFLSDFAPCLSIRKTAPAIASANILTAPKEVQLADFSRQSSGQSGSTSFEQE